MESPEPQGTEEDDFFEHARQEMFPKMAASSMVVTLLSGEPDAKLCLELGAALLFDKPILLVVYGPVDLPERVRRLAAAVVELEDGELISQGAGAERLQAAIESILGPPDPDR